MMAAMLNGTERITRIVNQVLVFSRDQSTKPPARVDLCACLEDALNLAAPHCADVVLEKRLQERYTRGSAQELTQVFINLLNNALHAVSGTTEGRVAIEVVPNQDGWTTVHIDDNGPGIDAAIGDKIFDPFFTTKDPGQGTGLGLSICHSIVTEHGGDIGFHSRPSQGTLFWVRLLPAEAETLH